MGYIVLQDLLDAGRERELIQLTDLVGTGTIDTAIVDNAIALASGVIDNYLARRYSVPITSPTEAVKGWAEAIALHYLYRDQPTDTVRQRYEDALRELRDIAAGRADLAGIPTAVTAGAPDYAAPGRVFTAGTLEDY